MSNREYRPSESLTSTKNLFQETKREQKIRRRNEAIDRANLRAMRSPEVQIEELDMFLGKGVGAKKERARLNRDILSRKLNDKNVQ